MTKHVISAAIALTAGTFGGKLFQESNSVQPVVRANRIELVSASGRVRAVFEATEDGATVQLADPSRPGMFVAINSSASAGGSITLSDHSGKQRIAIDGDLYGKPAISSFGERAETTLWLDHRLQFQVLSKKGSQWNKNLGMTAKQADEILRN